MRRGYPVAIHVNFTERVCVNVPIFMDVNTKCEYVVNEEFDKMFRRRTVHLLRPAQNKIIEISFIKLIFSFARYCV